MRLLGSLALGFVLLPAQARAQSVKLADIVGSWTRSDATIKQTLVFKADSTTNWATPSAVATFHRIARLSNDTIRFVPQGRNFKITLKDQELIVSTDQAANNGLKKGEFRFKRVQAPAATADSTPTPAPTPKP
jgi:hypothetical protein